jgi:DNA primase
MFPIWNDRGKVIAFGGRAIGDVQPKYLNSSESPLYSKSNVLYALHLARNAAQKAGKVVVVEGYFDCLSLHQNGIQNVVASCGTSLTPQQVKIMARFVPEVVMNYDPDAAGQNAMRRSIDLLLAENLRIRILKLPGGLDPDDFVRKEGADVYSRLLADAPYFWQYLIAEAARQHDLDQPASKADAVREVLHSVSRIQDRVEQLEVAREVAQGFKVPEAVIFEALKLSPRKPEIRPVVPRASVPAGRTLTPSEKQLIHAVLQDQDLARELEPFLDFLVEAWSRPVLEQLVKAPGLGLEQVLESITDEELRKEVRAAGMEPFTRVTRKEALSSLAQLRDAFLVKKEREIREQLERYGSGAAPRELMEMRMNIARMKGLSLEKGQ